MRRIIFSCALTMSFLPVSGAIAQDDAETIGLDTLIRSVVNDVTRAARGSSNSDGTETSPIFDLGETTLELKFTIEKNASGKIEASFWGIGSAEVEANAGNQKIQTVRIVLKPSINDALTGKETPLVQFSSFDPKKPSLLLDKNTYSEITNAWKNSDKEFAKPTGVDAAAIGVATDGVVVNEDQYKKWLLDIEKNNPVFKPMDYSSKAMRITIPNVSRSMVAPLSGQ